MSSDFEEIALLIKLCSGFVFVSTLNFRFRDGMVVSICKKLICLRSYLFSLFLGPNPQFTVGFVVQIRLVSYSWTEEECVGMKNIVELIVHLDGDECSIEVLETEYDVCEWVEQ